MSFTVTGVVGNPRPLSKTFAAAVALVEKVAEAIGAEVSAPIDLANYGGRALDYADPELVDRRRALSTARVLVVATPVYKGSYTGLLKAFLDGYAPDALSATRTIPLTIAASPQHSLAGSTHLQPLLDELGAISPGGGLFLPDATAADPEARDALFDSWIDARRALLSASGVAA
ncbi:NAD(P)H-dependent oxidoreductase [Agreia sp. PsM10]|uniref:NADPH-dependent FMN reductase n=1 Tax=Agreia sp. PsM10 TaxID=3030533 RepID=UPI00263B6D62|nr:NAD(P)H-dependent oxidoreductase [Agreia sp. PsM10]MDN4641951.1 NAD(P)H-dependent oxidoreductase [Agreia sp. PsM10]